MKFKSLNEAIKAEIPKRLENLLTKKNAKIREFTVHKHIFKDLEVSRDVTIVLDFGNGVEVICDNEPLDDSSMLRPSLGVSKWSSIGTFKDIKRVEETLKEVQDTTESVENALEVFQELKEYKFEDLMIVK